MVRQRFETLGVSIEPPERRTVEHFARALPREVERAALVVKSGGLTAQ